MHPATRVRQKIHVQRAAIPARRITHAVLQLATPAQPKPATLVARKIHAILAAQKIRVQQINRFGPGRFMI